MDNTSGFYKNEDGLLLFGPNGVSGPLFDLHQANRTEYTYPVAGWSWFDTEEEARTFFGLPAKIDTDQS